MAEKGTHKGRGRAKIDEDNDVFLSFINKRKRNNKKKLTEIEELEKRDQSTLKPEQLQKIKSKPEIFKQNAYWHEIKDLYYEALKTNQGEGGKKVPLQKDAPKEQEKAPVKEETQKTKKEEAPTKSGADAVRPILSLIHVNEFFGCAANREEFDKGYMNMSGSLGLSTFPDLKALNDFSNKVFKCTTGTTSGDCLDKAVAHIQKYVDGSDDKAAGDKSYAYVSDVVNKLVASDFFRGHKATHHEEHKKVEHKHAPTEHKHTTTEHKHAPTEHKHTAVEHKHAPTEHKHTTAEHKHAPTEHKHAGEHKHVGEHKHAGEHEHKHEPKKHESPKKTHPEEPKKKEDSPTKTSKTHHKEETRAPQENTEDWDKFEEDDYEEEDKHVSTKKTETKKADDGFVEVTAKYLDKKKTENTGRGGGRGSRRGSRRGEGRGGYKGGEGRPYKEGEHREYKGDRPHTSGGEGRPYRERHEGDKEGQPRQRRGDYQGRGDYRGNRRRGQGKEEYVPKQQGTTQPETTTQP